VSQGAPKTLYLQGQLISMPANCSTAKALTCNQHASLWSLATEQTSHPDDRAKTLETHITVRHVMRALLQGLSDLHELLKVVMSQQGHQSALVVT
jgi:hypothetical protein